MGKGKESMILSLCRQGFIFIPVLYLLNHLIGVYGIVWTVVVANVLTLIISFILYNNVIRHLPPANDATAANTSAKVSTGKKK
jgi:Na+-driven multidrug efflux pump